MNNLEVVGVTCLLCLHFLFDFVLQSDKMAISKSHSIKWLSIHSFIYSSIWFIFGIPVGICIFISHFMIDFVTSKTTSYLWKNERRHEFFVVIGFDQYLHMVVILLSFKIFGLL